MSKEGFDNEDLIKDYLNGKSIRQLNKNWQDFFGEMFGKLKRGVIVSCSKKGGLNKSDLIITVGKKSKSISVKTGAGNSVHQEPIEEFIQFLKDVYLIDNSLADDIRLFVWGDGTLNGRGNLRNRLSAAQFVKRFPEIVGRIKLFFKANKRDLVERFVITGSKSKSSPDYVYYGDRNNGYWKKTEEVVRWLCDESNESDGTIPVGKLTFQAWNRNINGGNKSEKKRGVIQLKWGSIGEDLKEIFSKK